MIYTDQEITRALKDANEFPALELLPHLMRLANHVDAGSISANTIVYDIRHLIKHAINNHVWNEEHRGPDQVKGTMVCTCGATRTCQVCLDK